MRTTTRTSCDRAAWSRSPAEAPRCSASSTAGRLSFAQQPGEYFLASVELDEADGVDVDVEELEVDLDDDDDDDEDALDYDDDDFDDDDDLDDDLDDADLVGLDELRWYLSNYD